MDFETLYRRYFDHVRRFAQALTGSAADADDITSATFVRAWTSTRPIRVTTAKGYLLTIARNLWRDQLRAARPASESIETLVHEQSPEASAIEAEHTARVLAAMRGLPQGDREALLLRTSGLGYDEISVILGISLTATKVRIFRARQKLKESL